MLFGNYSESYQPFSTSKCNVFIYNNGNVDGRLGQNLSTVFGCYVKITNYICTWSALARSSFFDCYEIEITRSDGRFSPSLCKLRLLTKWHAIPDQDFNSKSNTIMTDCSLKANKKNMIL